MNGSLFSLFRTQKQFNLLFMKERFTLLKSGLCSFFIFSLNHTSWGENKFSLKKSNDEERFALHRSSCSCTKATRANSSQCSLSKREESESLYSSCSLKKKRLNRSCPVLTWEKWIDRLFNFFKLKSDSLFMKERFALLKSGLCSFFIFSMNQTSWAYWGETNFCALFNSNEERFALYCSSHSCKKGNMSESLSSLFNKRAIHSFLSKNKQFAWKTKEGISNPSNMEVR